MPALGVDLGNVWVSQGAGTFGGVGVFVELVGELALVKGAGDVIPRRRIGGEKGLAACSS